MLSGVSNIFPSFNASITNMEIASLSDAEQHFSDCYLISALDSLSQSSNGRKVLQEQIQRDVNNPEQLDCYLYTTEGVKERYTIPTQKAVEGYEQLYKHQSNDIVRSLDISVSEFEKKHNSKPWFCRIADKFREFKFEFNLPSHFMEIFTGVKPSVNIAETALNIDLKSYRKEVMELFEKMDKNKDHSFVIGSGIKKIDGRRFHAYVLEDVNLAENKVTIKNKRGNERKTYTVDEVLDNFKYIVGYFNEDLEKKPQ